MFAGAPSQKYSPSLYLKITFGTPLCRIERNDTSSGWKTRGSQRYRMSHYAIDEWVDLTRGLVTGTEAVAMRLHADSCSECGRLSEFTMELTQICVSSASVTVPESALHLAR